MDAAAHADVWRKAGDDLAKLARDPHTPEPTRRWLETMGLAATIIGVNYVLQGRGALDPKEPGNEKA